MLLALWLLTLLPHVPASAEPRAPAGVCGGGPAARDALSVEAINQRYDDFFRMRRQAEARERVRDGGRAEVRDLTMARARDQELARREYVANRRPSPDTAAAEAEWDRALKARSLRTEEARRCYLSRKAAAERVTTRGRQIPADVEFGLNE